MQPTRYRFGIIGFGNRGRGHYRNLMRNFSDRVEVVAVADPRFAHEAAGSEAPERVYDNYHDLLASPDIDAVVIATHESAHVNAGIAATEAGKVVLLEKAVAPSWSEAVRLYRYVKSSGRPFKVALNLRHMPAAKVLREVLASNTIGRVVAATIHVNAGSDWGASCFRRFYANSELCGDLVLSKLTHDTDLVHHLLDTRANRVTGVVAKTTYIPKPGAGTDCDHCAITAECTEYVDLSDPALRARNDALLAQGQVPLNICPYTRPSTSHDTASFTGTYESGAVYTFVFTTAGPVYERRYTFNGTAGQVDAVLHGAEGASVVVHKTRHTPEVVPIPDEAGGHGGADPSMMASFLAYLDTQPSAPYEPESILTSVLIPLGGLTSAASGQTIDLAVWYRDATGEVG